MHLDTRSLTSTAFQSSYVAWVYEKPGTLNGAYCGDAQPFG
jgi:hypothetical protein